MSALTFDTLKFANTLKDAGVPDKQAEAEVQALTVVVEQLLSHEDLRHELVQIEARMEVKLAETKADLLRWAVAVGLLQITIITALLLRVLPA